MSTFLIFALVSLGIAGLVLLVSRIEYRRGWVDAYYSQVLALENVQKDARVAMAELQKWRVECLCRDQDIRMKLVQAETVQALADNNLSKARALWLDFLIARTEMLQVYLSIRGLLQECDIDPALIKPLIDEADRLTKITLPPES